MISLLLALIADVPVLFTFPYGARLELPSSFRTSYGVEVAGDASDSRPAVPRTHYNSAASGLALGASLQAVRTPARGISQSADVDYGPNYLSAEGGLNAAVVRRLKPAKAAGGPMAKHQASLARTAKLMGWVRLADLPIRRVESSEVNGQPGYRIRYATRRDRDGDALALGQVAATGPSGQLLTITVYSTCPKAVTTAKVDADLDASLRQLAASWHWKVPPENASVGRTSRFAKAATN